MKSVKGKFTVVYLAVTLMLTVGCHKEWQQPVLNTVNLSLLQQPDSVDENLVYYYADGMKLQMELEVTEGESSLANGIWSNEKNLHWEDGENVTFVKGRVINLSNDTSLHIKDYPVIMRVYRDIDVLYEDVKVENEYKDN